MIKFHELLSLYMRCIPCTGKELAEASGLSSSVISRYHTGERVPASDSGVLQQLSEGICALLPEGKGSPADREELYRQLQLDPAEPLTRELVCQSLSVALLADAIDYPRFLGRFQQLIQTLNLSMRELSNITSYDVSFLYRIKAGERRISNPADFSKKLAEYIAHHLTDFEQKEKLAMLLQLDPDLLTEKTQILKYTYQWLLSESFSEELLKKSPTGGSHISNFLQKMDDFNLEDFIKTIHFDKLKIPSVPFHLPATRYYYGIDEMRQGELDFFKTTVTSKNARTITMHSDMPMLDMAKDNEFNKKWMFGIACSIKKGLQISIIHHLDRPFEELLLGLEAWIPIYMTGQVSPYYLPDYRVNTFHHLNYVSEVAAIEGTGIAEYPTNGRYVLTNNKEELSYYQNRARDLLSHAKPLMDIYAKPDGEAFAQFFQDSAKLSAPRHNQYSTLPLYTLEPALLEEILKRQNCSEKVRKRIFEAFRLELLRFRDMITHSPVSDSCYIPTREEFQKSPPYLAISGTFLEQEINYTYEEFQSHLQSTKAMALQLHNYTFREARMPIFHNIQIEIAEDRYCMISKIKAPSIHFVIRHPRLLNALQHFNAPVIERDEAAR